MSHMNPAQKKQNTFLIFLQKTWRDETGWQFSAMMTGSPVRDVTGITHIPEHFPVFRYQYASQIVKEKVIT